MFSGITIKLLTHEPKVLQQLANYFTEEWYEHYGEGGKGNAYQDLLSFCQTEQSYPFALVALNADNEPVGMVAVKSQSIDEMAHLSPWIASGYVIPSLRGKGLGRLMAKELEKICKQKHIEEIFVGTATADSLLQRLDFEKIATANQSGHPVSIYRKVVGCIEV